MQFVQFIRKNLFIAWLFSPLESGRLDPIKSSSSLFPRVISGPDIPVAPCRLSSYNFDSKSPLLHSWLFSFWKSGYCTNHVVRTRGIIHKEEYCPAGGYRRISQLQYCAESAGAPNLYSESDFPADNVALFPSVCVQTFNRGETFR